MNDRVGTSENTILPVGEPFVFSKLQILKEAMSHPRVHRAIKALGLATSLYITGMQTQQTFENHPESCLPHVVVVGEPGTAEATTDVRLQCSDGPVSTIR